ncbi:MAG TPA: PAS domain S-box protein [Polyangia bacterium]|nr:PAS domain S-box protein [Polyangia bacterium]
MISQDEELFEHLDVWIDLLHRVAERWRFRAQAGRLGRHSLVDTLQLAETLDAAARLLESHLAAPAVEAPQPPQPQDATAAILRHSEDRFRLLVDSVKDYAIFLLDPEGRIVSWNAGAERIKGYRAEEIIGRHFSIFYPPELLEKNHPAHELWIASRDGRYREEQWRLRKDGTRFWADVTITALRDEQGHLCGFAKVTRDLTERREQEQALRQSEELFRLLLEGIQDYAIFMLDPEGRIATWNQGAERLKGYQAHEIIGQRFSVFYPEAERRDGKPERELAAARESGVYREEGWRVRKDGSRFWAEITLTAIHDKDGHLRGFAKVSRDRTERRAADEAIHRLNQELAERVRERTQALEAMSVANRELEAFSYSVSHDLRTPLRGIDGFSKLLLEKYAAMVDDKGRHYLERIRAASQRMSQLIDDLLKLSRITRAELRWSRLDLADLAREVAEELQRHEPGRHVEFSIVSAAPTQGDPDLLRVVIENLLRNAWKFTNKKPAARIEFGVAPIAIAPGGDGRDGQRTYFVRDNGAGFDMEYAGKLFTPFQRLHDASEFEGTGIGLATVQRIILRHGGRIWGEGASDQGATFWFTLGEARR